LLKENPAADPCSFAFYDISACLNKAVIGLRNDKGQEGKKYSCSVLSVHNFFVQPPPPLA
jgi:hypothetical protein